MNVHGVAVTVVPLPREVSRRMTIHAPRVVQHANHGFEIGGAVIFRVLFRTS